MLAVRVRNELSKMAVAVWGHRLEAADAISAALTVKRVPVIIDVRNNILWSIQLILGGCLECGERMLRWEVLEGVFNSMWNCKVWLATSL